MPAASNLGAHSVGAPHIRQRLYWVADAGQEQRGRRPHESRSVGEDAAERHEKAVLDQRCCAACAMADRQGDGRREGRAHPSRRDERVGAEGPGLRSANDCCSLLAHAAVGGSACSEGPAQADGAARPGPAGVGQADATEPRLQGCDEPRQRADAQRAAVERGGSLGGCCERRAGPYAAVCACPWRPWRHLEWIACRDGKARPTEPGLQPLAHGVSKSVVRSGNSDAPLDADATGEARVMRLRGYGNAIVPQVAAMFVRASMEVSA